MNTPITPVFIGYNRLEEWAEVVSLPDPIYALLVEEPGPASAHGYQVKRQVIVCAWPDRDIDIQTNSFHFFPNVIAKRRFLPLKQSSNSQKLLIYRETASAKSASQ